MNRFFYPLLPLLFIFVLVRADDMAQDTTPPRYFDPATIKYDDLLPDPPDADSSEEAKEIAIILHDQAARTPEQLARIQNEANHLNVWLFASVMGPWFTEKNLPLTTQFFNDVDNNEWLVARAAKEYWHRPRPPQRDPRVHPPIPLPNNASYPSGHSTYGTVDALVLAELAPDLKQSLVARGKQIGDDRIVAGVHFPSDVTAGRTLGNAIFKALMNSSTFRSDLYAAKSEIAAARAEYHPPAQPESPSPSTSSPAPTLAPAAPPTPPGSSP